MISVQIFVTSSSLLFLASERKLFYNINLDTSGSITYKCISKESNTSSTSCELEMP